MIHLYVFLAIVSLLVLIKRKTIFNGFGRNLTRLIVLKIISCLSSILDLFLIIREKVWMNSKWRVKHLLNLQNSFIGSIPLPLPAPYIEGMDLTTYMNELGAGDINVSDANYILGEKRTGTGFWYYYLVVFVFKTPLIALLSYRGLLLFICKKEKQGHPSTMLFSIGFDLLFPSCTWVSK